MARRGHLCIKESDPLPFALEGEEKAFLEKQIKEGFADLPPSVCRHISDAHEIPLLPVCLFKQALYLQKNWILESEFLFHLQRLSAKALERPAEPFAVSAFLNAEQKKAVIQAITSPVSLITGGPGTGKSFTAIEIIQVFLASLSEDKRKDAIIQLAAPTGSCCASSEKCKRSFLLPYFL